MRVIADEHDHAAAPRALIVQAASRRCAVPLTVVREISRPLPVHALDGDPTRGGVPAFVRGATILRGTPTPVVDLGALLGAASPRVGRFVALRIAERPVVLAVESVSGIFTLDVAQLSTLPPLLASSSSAVIEALGALDQQLLLVLRTGWTLPETVWQALARRGASA